MGYGAGGITEGRNAGDSIKAAVEHKLPVVRRKPSNNTNHGCVAFYHFRLYKKCLSKGMSWGCAHLWGIVQLVERQILSLDVGGSSPPSPTKSVRNM